MWFVLSDKLVPGYKWKEISSDYYYYLFIFLTSTQGHNTNILINQIMRSYFLCTGVRELNFTHSKRSYTTKQSPKELRNANNSGKHLDWDHEAHAPEIKAGTSTSTVQGPTPGSLVLCSTCVLTLKWSPVFLVVVRCHKKENTKSNSRMCLSWKSQVRFTTTSTSRLHTTSSYQKYKHYWECHHQSIEIKPKQGKFNYKTKHYHLDLSFLLLCISIYVIKICLLFRVSLSKIKTILLYYAFI